MATFSTDFSDSDQVIGSQPPDWTAQFEAAPSPSTADFEIKADTTGSSFGGQVLNVDYLFSGDSALSFDDPGDAANVDMTMRVRWLTTSSLQRSCGLVARGHEDSAGIDGYTITVDLNASTLKLYKLVDDADTSLATGNVYPSIAQDVWYWLRFQVNGTALKARIWRDGDPEPVTWHIDTTDSAVSAAGWCGLYTRYIGDAEVDWFGVGTAGDAPPAQPAAEGAARVTQVAVEVLRVGDPDARVTQVSVEVLRRNRRNPGSVVVIVG